MYVYMCAHILSSSGSLLFIVFNFMLSIQADISKAAVRMGVLEVGRYCVTWLLTAYVFFASPSSVSGTEERPLPFSVLLLLLPLALLILVLYMWIVYNVNVF